MFIFGNEIGGCRLIGNGIKRDAMLMRIVSTPEARIELSRALMLMGRALRILDDSGAQGEIGAILDLAIARLEAALKGSDRPTELQQMIARLEEELARPRAEAADINPWEIRPM